MALQLCANLPFSSLALFFLLSLLSVPFLFLGRHAPSPLATLDQVSLALDPRHILELHLDIHTTSSLFLVSLHAACRRPSMVLLELALNS